MLTWRKTYRKYKPRTTPGKCNVCAKKDVRQAYCTVCRPCAQTHGVCEKCGQKPKEGKVQAPQSKEEQLAEEQRMQYELKFMSERQRRSALRKMEQEGDRQYQRRLAFLERKKAEAAEAGEEAEAWDEHEDEWASATQPTDLQSQQRVLVAFYVSAFVQRWAVFGPFSNAERMHSLRPSLTPPKPRRTCAGSSTSAEARSRCSRLTIGTCCARS